jgi:hypothetical protein
MLRIEKEELQSPLCGFLSGNSPGVHRDGRAAGKARRCGARGLSEVSTSFSSRARQCAGPGARRCRHRRLAPAAENLFLRKQLALFRERERRAEPTTPADRLVFSKLAHWLDWRSALIIVKPATLIGWHRAAFRCFGRWKSKTCR